jgi:hypothetical protein
MPRILPVLALLPLLACGADSPTKPSEAGGSGILEGQTVSAVDGSASPNLAVQVGTHNVKSDGTGVFQVDMGGPGTYRTIVRGSPVVERDTTITGPTGERARLSLIPSTFDLGAFDEMFRASNARLQRWTTKPGLVVLATVMTYRNTSDGDYTASAEQLTEDEVNLMVAHMTEGLALLTGNTFTNFAAVEIERPASGSRVNVLRTSRIVVGRYNGIVSLANTIGYGQWAEAADGTITGGAMYLDRDFDRGDARRRLLRIHELGHALGYQHVRARPSIMNTSIGPEPTEFDRAGALIAFQRPVGNRAPDADPGSSTRASSVSEGGSRWAPPIFCK